MTQPAALGRTWWMSLITIVLQTLLTLLQGASTQTTPTTVAALAALTAVAIAHNVARTMQDKSRDALLAKTNGTLEQS